MSKIITNLKYWTYYNCVITVYNSHINSDVRYDGYISSASDTAVHLSEVRDVTSILSSKQMNGTYIFDYSVIKSAYVYRMIRDRENSLHREILFSC